jgi:hypothetical protein
MADVTYNLNGGFKPTMKRFADLSGPDFFPTPPWATFALIDNEKFSGDIWESACGDGTMSRVLEQTGQPVRGTKKWLCNLHPCRLVRWNLLQKLAWK